MPPPTSLSNQPLDFDDFVDDAFHHFSPSPPPSFLDNILNPAHPAELPFGYRQQQAAPSRRRAYSPTPHPIMRPSRSTRFGNNAYVDLTDDPDPPRAETQTQRPSRRVSPTPGPSAKRLKREDGAAVDRHANNKTPAKIDEIDLSDGKTELKDILQKQRQDAVQAQQAPQDRATTFNNLTCVICMDTPTDLTATSCGHVFCHTCLMEALIAGENRSGPNEPKRSQCPVCRKFINRTKTSDVIPLLLKKGMATQPTAKKNSSGAGASFTAKMTQPEQEKGKAPELRRSPRFPARTETNPPNDHIGWPRVVIPRRQRPFDWYPEEV